ncbi:MAG: hypothetical protein K8U57_40740 [Planctomycetes bacterium]|nr:hypothetical protein [Planctomycetota bacterium]
MVAPSAPSRNEATPDRLADSAPRSKHAIERSPKRPTPLRVEHDGIPMELQRQPNWVAWRYELTIGKDKTRRWTKVPTVACNWLSPEHGGNAKSTDPMTWTKFGCALLYYFEDHGADGISFVFSEADPFCGVDLDDSYDPVAKCLKDWAQPIVESLDSYTEISPSATGVKVFLKGEIPGPRRKKGDVEMYDRDRVFTVTGHHLPGTPETVNERPAALLRLYTQTFGTIKPPQQPKAVTKASAATASVVFDDAVPDAGGLSVDEVVRLASAGPKGDKFKRLWAGDCGGYESQSAADMALCSILAFWCRRNAGQMDSAFRRSGLFRPKWNRSSYREPTLRKAVSGCTRVYEPAARTPPFTPEEYAELVPLLALLDMPGEPTPPATAPASPSETAPDAGPEPTVEPPHESTAEQLARMDRLHEGELAETDASLPRAVQWTSAHSSGPAVYIDQDPPDHPAHVVRQTIANAGIRRSLTVLRSGHEVDAAASTLRTGVGSGTHVAQYPKRTAANCQNIREVQLAQQTGLAAGSAVCPSCPHNLDGTCVYQKEMELASRADHRVVSSARAAGNLAQMAKDVDAVFLLRDALDVLAPHAAVCRVRREHLAVIADAAGRAAKNARFRGRPGAWWQSLRDVAEAVSTRLAAGIPVAIPLPSSKKPPSLWGVTLWGALRGADCRAPALPGGLIRLLTAAASGRLRALELHPGECGDGLLLVGVWLPCVPPNVTVFAVEVLRRGGLADTGLTATDITTVVPPAWRERAIQIPRRRVARQRPGAVVSLLRGFLARHPGERLCVLLPGRRTMAEALAVEVVKLLEPTEAALVNLVPWHGDCGGRLPAFDRVVGFGVPGVPPGSVRRRLIQAGDGDSARTDGDWGTHTWTGRDAAGAEIAVAEQGYRHSAWQSAYRELVEDSLRRRLVSVAVPVVLMTDFELGLPLSVCPPALRPKYQDLLAAVDAELAESKSAENVRGRIEHSSYVFRRLEERGAATARIAVRAGIAVRTAGDRLKVMERSGLVAAIRNDKGRLRGWIRPGMDRVAGTPETSTQSL